MKVLIMIILLLTSSASFAIKNAPKVKHKEYPKLVKLDIGNNICTGIRIHRDYVLTASHCFPIDYKKKFKVTFYEMGKKKTQKIEIDKVILKGRDLSEELAIIPIESELNTYTAPTIIDFDSIDFSQDKIFNNFGFGVYNKRLMGKLRKGESKFRELYKRPGKEDMFMVQMTDQGQNPCHGDSGGPLFLNNELVAIVSFISSTEEKIGKLSQSSQCKKANIATYIPLSRHMDFLTRFLDSH